jgi:predicted ATPase
MLIRFEVENFRSILEPAEITMVAVDDDREQVRQVTKLGASLVTTSGIFGPNASGKSNVLASLAWLRDAVRLSLRQWDDIIPIEPFAFEKGRDRDTSFALDLLVDGTRFEYLLQLNEHRVELEALFQYPEGRRRRVFEREGNDLILQRGFGDLSGTRSLLTDRSLALSIMRRFDEPHTATFARALLGTVSLGQPTNGFRRPNSPGLQSTLRIFGAPHSDDMLLFDLDESQSTRDQAMALLRLADLGVLEVEVEEPEIDLRNSSPFTRRSAQLVHSSHSERLPFDYRKESAGTRTWFELIGPVLSALERGSLVLFDELDASLHPTLTAQLLRLFQNRNTNPRGAQLIFTTHDTSLLNHLNRDEVWLTQKGNDGATKFAALSDFAGERVRKSANIENSYLSGRFGALPDVARPDVLRDLGLIG